MRSYTGIGGLACATALVLLAALLWAGPAGAQSSGPIPGGTYTGTGVDTSGACGEGALTIGEELGFRLNNHGTMITGITVTDLVTPLGSFDRFTIPVSIPIDQDGRFDEDFDPLDIGLAIVHFDGQFEGDTVSGSFSVEVAGVVECAGTFSAQGSPPPPLPPVTFIGTIEAVAGNCGGGSITVTVSGDRLSVLAIEVYDFDVHGTSTSGTATFAEGTVPIAEDGSFGWTYFPGSEMGQEIAVIGTLSSVRVSGGVTVSPSTCGAVSFASVSPLSLGQGGSGPAAQATDAAQFWAAVLGAAGVVALAAGAAARRRTS